MYVHNSCFVKYRKLCNFECLFMILSDLDIEFKRFQGSICNSIYELLELELLRVRQWEVRNREVTHWSHLGRPKLTYSVCDIKAKLTNANQVTRFWWSLFCGKFIAYSTGMCYHVMPLLCACANLVVQWRAPRLHQFF